MTTKTKPTYRYETDFLMLSVSGVIEAAEHCNVSAWEKARERRYRRLLKSEEDECFWKLVVDCCACYDHYSTERYEHFIAKVAAQEFISYPPDRNIFPYVSPKDFRRKTYRQNALAQLDDVLDMHLSASEERQRRGRENALAKFTGSAIKHESEGATATLEVEVPAEWLSMAAWLQMMTDTAIHDNPLDEKAPDISVPLSEKNMDSAKTYLHTQLWNWYHEQLQQLKQKEHFLLFEKYVQITKRKDDE